MTQVTYNKELFKGSTAVVTGGTSGLGAATAFYFADLGAKVYAVGLQADQLEIPAGKDVIAVELDVTDEGKVENSSKGWTSWISYSTAQG